MPEFELALDFRPTDFTQVNVEANRLLIRRAIDCWRRSRANALPTLCGLGKLQPATAPPRRVRGGRGGQRCAGAACCGKCRRERPAEQTEFHAANLFEATEDSLPRSRHIDKMLTDPPREGAIAVAKALTAIRQGGSSMRPATRRRWHGMHMVLVHQKRLPLEGCRYQNMFAQTLTRGSRSPCSSDDAGALNEKRPAVRARCSTTGAHGVEEFRRCSFVALILSSRNSIASISSMP